MRACWAVPCEEAPGRGLFAVWVAFFPVLGFLRPNLVWFGCMIPGLYEVIRYALSLFFAVRPPHQARSEVSPMISCSKFTFLRRPRPAHPAMIHPVHLFVPIAWIHLRGIRCKPLRYKDNLHPRISIACEPRTK
jgi:hypothetical protein